MKQVILSFSLLVVSLLAVGTATAQEVATGAEISFDKEVHDYGTIEANANGECTFTFTNTGTTPLIISRAKGSCGCTVPSWPKEPIAPGKTGEINVKYDTKRVGPINKQVTITSNATNAPNKVIRISGTVKAKPTGTAPVNGAGAPTN